MFLFLCYCVLLTAGVTFPIALWYTYQECCASSVMQKHLDCQNYTFRISSMLFLPELRASAVGRLVWNVLHYFMLGNYAGVRVLCFLCLFRRWTCSHDLCWVAVLFLLVYRPRCLGIYLLAFSIALSRELSLSCCLYVICTQRGVLLSSWRPCTCMSFLFSIASVLFLPIQLSFYISIWLLASPPSCDNRRSTFKTPDSIEWKYPQKSSDTFANI